MKYLVLLAAVYSVWGDNTQTTIVTQNDWADDQKLLEQVKRIHPEWNIVGDQGHPEKRFKPEWNDLDTRPLPEWYDRAKIGIFLHWGVYSVPSYQSEWFWLNLKTGNENTKRFMDKNYPPGFTYQQFAPSFTAEFFNSSQWADLFKKAGAKYVVLTSKHHEGFTLFPSKHSFSWNSVEVGPHQDLVGALSKAVKGAGLEFGVYHSLFEWFHPLYLKDKASNFSSSEFINNKVRPDIEQLVKDYEPSVLWSDGDWETYDTYWKSTDILAWLYNDSPVKDKIVVNDRWGKGTAGKHGDFYNVADRYNPGTLQSHKWENAFTIDKNSWGFRRNLVLSNLLTIEEILQNVVSTVSCGGNALINVGPTKEGTIVPIFQERLLALGKWLDINGEAIYGSSPWQHQNDSGNGEAWYTCAKKGFNAVNPTSPPTDKDTLTAIYVIFLNWPSNSVLKLKDIAATLHSNYKIVMLGQGPNSLSYTVKEGEAFIRLPNMSSVKSKHAWTLKITALSKD